MLDLIKIARPDHWFKNVFVLPGIFLGALVSHSKLGISDFLMIFYGLFIVCLTASANYVINEIMDAASDKHHPKKRHRPIPSGRVKKSSAFLVWVGFLFLSLFLASTVNQKFLMVTIAFIFQGLLYNIPPIRTKDLPYLDVITESVNNPIRFMLGWFMIITVPLPTLSLVLAYWTIGAFFMASKRYAEFVMINDQSRAAAYRNSFGHYSKNKLFSLLRRCLIVWHHCQLDRCVYRARERSKFYERLNERVLLARRGSQTEVVCLQTY